MPLRFTIRDLLWLTLVVALGVGWWVDHKKQQRYEILPVQYDGFIDGILIDHETGEKHDIMREPH